MGMHTDGCDDARIRSRKRRCLGVVFHAVSSANRDDGRDACCPRALEHRGAVRVELTRRKVGVGVDPA